MPQLSGSMFYGISNATKSDSSYLKLNNGATKRFLRVTIPLKTCDKRQNSSKKEMLCNPSSSTHDSPLNYETNSKKTCDKRQNSSKKEMLCSPSSSTHDSPLNYETMAKKVKLENTSLCHDTSELSDYENQIQNNIAERMKFLENLNIFDAKKSLKESIELTRTKRKNQKKENIENKKTPNMIRKSLRLQHLEAEEHTLPIETYSEFHKKEIIRTSPVKK